MNRDRDRGPRKFGRKPLKKKVCQFCTEDNVVIDYKNTSRLRKFISDRGKIYPRRHTGTCAKHQRQLTTAVKQARMIALLPFTSD
jgi:small subunit ribosomal protein S18